MNGEIKTYKLDEPMTWDEFKKLPNDIQKKYIENLRELYHASGVMLAQLFGVSESSIASMLKRLGIKSCTRTEGHVIAIDKNIQSAWKAFCNGVIGGKKEERVPIPKTLTEKYVPLPETLKQKILENQPMPIDKMGLVYHDIRSLAELREQIGNLDFVEPMQVQIYICKETKQP